MNLNLALDQLPEPERVVFESLSAQMGVQWGVAHSPEGRNRRRLISAYNSVIQTVADITWTSVEFNSEDDLRGMPTIDVPVGVHDLTTRTDRFVITAAMEGFIRVRARVIFADNGTGSRGMRLMKNDAVYRYGTQARAAVLGFTSGTGIESVFDAMVAEGDEIHLQVYQDSGGNLGIGGVTRDFNNEITVESL